MATASSSLQWSTSESKIQIVQDFQRIGLLHSAATALIVYDVLIGLHDEIQYVWKWKRRMSGASFLYYVLRYAPLLNRGSVLFSLVYMDRNSLSCQTLSWIYEMLSFFTFASIAVLSALRVYAVWDGNRALFILLLLLGLVLPSVHLVIRVFPAVPEITTPWYTSMTCRLSLADPLSSTSLPEATASLLLIVSRFASVASDLLVVFLVSWKTIVLPRQAILQRISSSLVVTMLKEGTIYFIILVAFSVSLMFAFSHANYDGSFDLILVISSILMARFFVHLRIVASPSHHKLNDSVFKLTTQNSNFPESVMTSPRFAIALDSPSHPLDTRHTGDIVAEGEEELEDDVGMDWKRPEPMYIPSEHSISQV